MTTDTSEKGLEDLIVTAMTGRGKAPASSADGTEEPTADYGGTGWILGDAKDYDREFALDLAQLRAFLNATQPETAAALELDSANPTRQKFLARLQAEITKRGIVDVLRHGIKVISIKEHPIQRPSWGLAFLLGAPSPSLAR